jgi:hypothetical protein
LSTSGTSLGAWEGGQTYDAAIAPRTDNSAYFIYKYGSAIYWAIMPAGGGTPTFSKQSSYPWSDGGYSIAQAATDSSNNLYSVTTQGRIFKIDSAGTSISGCYPSASENYGSVQVYGSYVYVMTSNNSNSQLYIRAYNTSLTPQWVNTFNFSGASTNISATQCRMMATPQGLFLYFNNNTYGNFILKVPLTGVPSNSSKALSAPSGLTLNWTTGSFSVTTLAFNSITTYSLLNAGAYNPTSTSAYPAGATTAPANTNTAL